MVDKLYMEPHIGMDENGRSVYDTKNYFQSLSQTNRGLVKGFFEQNSVNSMDTNYIGIIGQNSDGQYNRTMDYKFLDKYKEIVKAEKEQKVRDAEIRKQKEDNQFRSSLQEGTHSGYQNWCDNLDKRCSGETLEDKQFKGSER